MLFFSPFFHKFILKSILRVENLKYKFNCKCRKWLHVFSEKKQAKNITTSFRWWNYKEYIVSLWKKLIEKGESKTNKHLCHLQSVNDNI